MFRHKLRRITTLATGLATTAIGLVAVGGENDLYTDVQAGSVFSAGDSSKGTESTETPRITRRITSLEQLAQLVRDASFDPKTTAGRSVTTLKSLEPWLFPVSVTLSDDEQHLQICVALGAIADKQKTEASKLLALLEANKRRKAAKFGFNTERSRTELLGQLRNDGVTAELLRDEINRLALVAKESEFLWQIEPARLQAKTDSDLTIPESAVRIEVVPPVAFSANGAASPAAGDATTITDSGTVASTSPPTGPAASIVTPAVTPSPASGTAIQSSAFTGRWSASRAANEAFAILFGADGSFVLISIKDSKQARSSGKFSVSGSQLTLEATDGTRLNGTVQMKSATEFSYQPISSTGAVAAFDFRKSL